MSKSMNHAAGRPPGDVSASAMPTGAAVAFGYGSVVVVGAHSDFVVLPPEPRSATEESTYLLKAQIARHLRVSTRWVERHLHPTAQASMRGRAWYTLEDVEAQLARMNIHKRPTSASTVPSAAQRRARKVAATAQPRPDGAEHARRVAEIERSLLERSSDEHPRGAKPRRRK